MNIFSYLFALLTSVGVMTAFSAIMSVKLKCEFREHILLSKLISNHSLKQKENGGYLMLGWLIHFLIGGFFLVVYAVLWEYIALIRTLLGSIVFGILIGVMGIIGWTILFKLDSNPPNINFHAYYIQLIIAHVFFSLGNLVIFLLLD